MPGPLYRMHGAVTGAYDIANVDVTNRVVLTNKMPASLIRGFGGPQLYLALERLVQRIAIELELDHLDVIKRNLVPKEKFPYQAAAGALYDSGDYLRAVETATGDGRLADLERRRDAARAAGRHYGIGFAVVIEPGMSNMGYLSTLLTPEARDKAGPKNGAVSMVTVNVDPLGAVSVTADVTVQGQGHETVLSQIVADRLGLAPDDINVVLEMDTAKDQWSIAAGTYSCRFTPGTAVAAHLAAERMADKLKAIAAKQLNVLPEDIELVGGKIRSRSNPDNALPFGRVAGTSHWSPVMLPDGMAPALRETAVWSPPELEPPSSDDRINTSLTYGFVFDMCGIEIDPLSYQVRVDRYVSMHDAGRILNPMIADGQMRGAFVQGIAAALYEEFVYDDGGQFLTGTFADYLVPTVAEIPRGRDAAPGNAVAVHAARRQGSGRRQLHERAGLHRQRHRRRARRQGRAAAGDAAPHPRADGGPEASAAPPQRCRPPEPADEAAAVRLCAARHGRRGGRDSGRARRRRARACRRPDADGHAQSAAGRAGGAGRYHAHCRARRHPRGRRQDRGRRRGHAEPAAGLAGACARSFRCWRRRCRSSATSRPATRARSAARSRTPTRPRKFRCRSRCSKARWCCARAGVRACSPPANSSRACWRPRASPMS